MFMSLCAYVHLGTDALGFQKGLIAWSWMWRCF